MVHTPSSLREEALRIIQEGEARGAVLRLLGGAAVLLHTHTDPQLFERLGRVHSHLDIDYMGYKRQSGSLRKLMEDLGFEPNRQLNAYHGHKRQQWFDNNFGSQVDIFLDVFEMCHVIDMKDRLAL